MVMALRGSVAFLILAAILAVPARAVAPFTCAEGRFRAAMPAPPILESTTQGTPVGDLTFHAYVVRQGPSACSVTYADLPALAIALRNGREGVYDEAARILLEKAGGRLENKAAFKQAGHRGRQMTYGVAATSAVPARRGQARLFLVGRRLYVVDTVVPADSPAGSAEAFLDSFEVLGG